MDNEVAARRQLQVAPVLRSIFVPVLRFLDMSVRQLLVGTAHVLVWAVRPVKLALLRSRCRRVIRILRRERDGLRRRTLIHTAPLIHPT